MNEFTGPSRKFKAGGGCDLIFAHRLRFSSLPATSRAIPTDTSLSFANN